MQHQKEYQGISEDFVYIDAQRLSALLDYQPPLRTQSSLYFYEATSINDEKFIICFQRPADQLLIETVLKGPIRYEGRPYTLTDERLERIMDSMNLSSLQAARELYGYTYLRVGDYPNGILEQSCFVIFFLLVLTVLVWYYLTRGYASSMKEINGPEEIELLLADWSMVDRTFEKQGVLLGQHFIFLTSGGTFFRYQDIQDITFGKTPLEENPNGELRPASLLRLYLKNRRIIYLGSCSSFDPNKNLILREQLKSTIMDRKQHVRR